MLDLKFKANICKRFDYKGVTVHNYFISNFFLFSLTCILNPGACFLSEKEDIGYFLRKLVKKIFCEFTCIRMIILNYIYTVVETIEKSHHRFRNFCPCLFLEPAFFGRGRGQTSLSGSPLLYTYPHPPGRFI